MNRMLLTTLMAVFALVATVACGSSGGDSDDGDFDTSDRLGSTGGAGVEEGGEPDGDRAAPADGTNSSEAAYQLASERKIIFTSTLDLEAEDVRGSFDRAALIARQAGGYVEESSLTNREGNEDEPLTYASITMRVPVGAYDGVLADLRGLPGAEVVREDSDSTEVTEEYTDLESRLRNLERTEATYLGLLDRAETIEDILKVNDRLDGVRGQIEQIQGRLNVLDDLTELATIAVSLAPVDATVAVSTDDGGPPSFLEALEGALEWSGEALRYVAAAAGVALVGAAWAAVALVALFAGSKLLRRGAES